MSNANGAGSIVETAMPAAENNNAMLLAVSRIGANLPVGISGFSSWMLGVGTMIGSMAWLIYGYMLSRSGAAATLAAWLLAAVINLPLCFILAELSSMFPSAGGPYVYKYAALKRLFPAYGEFLGFCTGWLYWVTMVTGLACMANGFAGLLGTTFWTQTGSAPVWFGPLSVVALFGATTLLNFNHISAVSRLNNLFTLLKLAMAIAFIALVFSAKGSSISYILPSATDLSLGTLAANVMKVLVLAITAFAGIELVGCTSSETVNPKRTVPRAIMMTLVTVAAIYFLLALSVFSAARYSLASNSYSMIIAGTNFSADCPSLAAYLGGPLWGKVFTAGVLGSIITCGFVSTLALARISYSMSQTGLFPASFSRLTAKDAIPRDALVFQFLCLTVVGVGTNIASRIFANFDAYTFLGEVFGFLYSLLAVLYGVSLISLRYTAPNWPRAFRLGKGNGLAWILTIITALVYGFVAFACAQLSHQLTALVLLLFGFPVYWICNKKGQSAGEPARD